MDEKYDPKAKKLLQSTTTYRGVELTVGRRVQYAGSSPVFTGRSGKLTKLKREWVSARTLSRAGFVGADPGYTVTAFVLWDGLDGDKPQSCGSGELLPA